MDTTLVRPRWRFNLAYRTGPQLRVGVEYNAAAGEWSPTANWTFQPEKENKPMLMLGTSSDRIFTPPGYQAVFLTCAKHLKGTPISPYVLVHYSGFEERLIFPFGANIALNDTWELTPMNDGKRSHLLLTWKGTDLSVSFMAVDLKRPKFGTSISFAF